MNGLDQFQNNFNIGFDTIFTRNRLFWWWFKFNFREIKFVCLLSPESYFFEYVFP